MRNRIPFLYFQIFRFSYTFLPMQFKSSKAIFNLSTNDCSATINQLTASQSYGLYKYYLHLVVAKSTPPSAMMKHL